MDFGTVIEVNHSRRIGLLKIEGSSERLTFRYGHARYPEFGNGLHVGFGTKRTSGFQQPRYPQPKDRVAFMRSYDRNTNKPLVIAWLYAELWNDEVAKLEATPLKWRLVEREYGDYPSQEYPGGQILVEAKVRVITLKSGTDLPAKIREMTGDHFYSTLIHDPGSNYALEALLNNGWTHVRAISPYDDED